MMHLHYTLKQEEICRYYEFAIKNDEKTKKEQILVKSWIPSFSLMIALFLRAQWFWYLIALFVSLLWIFIFAPLVFDNIVATAAKRKIKKDNIAMPEIDIKVDENILYNDKPLKVDGVASYMDLFIIISKDKENLIVPESAFNSDKDLMEKFIRTIMTSARN